MLVLIDWLLGGHLRAIDDGALALAVLYLIQDALQAFFLGSVLGVEHVGDDCCLGDVFEQHHAGFLVEDAGTLRTPERSQSEGDQLLIVCRSDGERYQFGEVVLLYIRSKWRCVCIDIYLLRDGLLCTQLAGTMRAEVSYLFLQK